MTIHSGSWSGWTKTSDAWAPWRSRSAPLFVVACLSLIAPAAALGQTFASPGNLSNTSGQPSTLPDIASTGNKVYVVWREEVLSPSFTFIQQIRVRASADGGESFSDGPSGKVILEASLGQTIFAVRVAAFGNNVYVLAAIGLPGGKPFLARSTDNDANFSGFALLPSGSGWTNFSTSPWMVPARSTS